MSFKINYITTKDLQKFRETLIQEIHMKYLSLEDKYDNKIDWCNALINEMTNSTRYLNRCNNKNINRISDINKILVVISLITSLLSIISIGVTIFK